MKFKLIAAAAAAAVATAAAKINTLTVYRMTSDKILDNKKCSRMQMCVK